MSTTPPWFELPQIDWENVGTIAPVIIVGSGLAGCHTAYELAQRNIQVLLLDAGETIAAGASGNDAGIVKPFVTRTPTHADAFYKAAFAYLLNRFNADDSLRNAAQFQQCGVLQLLERAYPHNNAYSICSAQQASALAGVAINSDAIHFENGGWLNPASLCRALVKHQNIDLRMSMSVRTITKTDAGWSLAIGRRHTKQPQPQPQPQPIVTPTASVDRSIPQKLTASETACETLECKTLILANGNQLNAFAQTQELPITSARGQTSRFEIKNENPLKSVVTGKRYAIPNGDSIVVGASFERDNDDTQLSLQDHQQNLIGLNTLLPALELDSAATRGFCAIRATTPDRLPMIGPVPEFSVYREDYALLRNGLPEHRFAKATYQTGLFVIGGFGSRGIVSAPYCAKLLVDHLCDAAENSSQVNTSSSETLSNWSALLHPARFIIRELKRAPHLVYSKTS